MKKIFFIIPGLVMIILVVFMVISRKAPQNESAPANTVPNSEVSEEEPTTSMANPVSKYCEENGGKLEIVTNGDGSQFGLCNLSDYSCEEWAYMNDECAIEEDAEKIKDALTAKGLNLSQSKVVIHKHLGKYISGGVVPVDMLGGGGYVFAVKDADGNISIVADGNGAIMCTMLENYPDFPTYLIPECIDETGTQIAR